MRNTRLFTAGGIVILLLVVFLLQLGCGGDKAPTKKADDASKETAEETATEEETAEETEAVAAVYECPMHPDETSTNPDDKCSECGMALKLVSDDADDAAEHGEDDGHGHE